MFLSAREFFRPTEEMMYTIIRGDEGWPNGTMMRYHHLLRELPDTDNVFMVDADMLFVAPIGDEVIGLLETVFMPCRWASFLSRITGF